MEGSVIDPSGYRMEKTKQIVKSVEQYIARKQKEFNS